MVKQIGREGEAFEICTLAELQTKEADMFTTVWIGNRETIREKNRMITPRGYKGIETNE